MKFINKLSNKSKISGLQRVRRTSMKNKIITIVKHPLFYGSGILMVGTLIANFFSFLFNLFMSRNLSVADYGILASIAALIGFPTLIVGAVVPLIVNFAGNYFATGRLDMVRGLYLKLHKFLFFIGLVVWIIFLLGIPVISNFFHLNDTYLLFIASIIIFISCVSIINYAFLQAKLAFISQVVIITIGTITKLALGALLVFAGFGVSGAVFALFVSGAVAYLVSYIPFKFIFDKKIGSPSIDMKELFSYGLPSSLTLMGLTSFISADIILVKHFFNSTEAGLYAGLSLIGRVIFYISSPIASVMFPLVVQKYSKNENFTNTFKLAIFFVFLPSVFLTLFYYYFPEFTILFFLKKTEYLSMSPLLWLFGIFISLYCLLSIISNFYLSIKKTKIFIPILIGAILQIILICLFHDNFIQIISICIIITFLLVCMLLIYYPYATKKKLQK